MYTIENKKNAHKFSLLRDNKPEKSQKLYD